MQSIVASMPLHQSVPPCEISVFDLAQELDRRQSINLKIESAAKELQQAKSAIDRATQSQAEIRDAKQQAETDREQQLKDSDAELESEILRLRERHFAKKQRIIATAKNAVATSDQLIAVRAQEIEALRSSADRTAKIAAAEPEDIETLRLEISQAEKRNAMFRENQRRAEAAKQADAAKLASEQLTSAIDKIDADKSTALANAKFPVDGLSFDESGVVFNGIPFDQASSAEQLRVSAAICFAMNPTLRVLLIRDGSLLDSDGLKTLAEIAEERDAQIWIETVSDGSKVGVVIEDGCVVNQEAAEPAAV
jgi:hypothetical protein